MLALPLCSEVRFQPFQSVHPEAGTFFAVRARLIGQRFTGPFQTDCRFNLLEFWWLWRAGIERLRERQDGGGGGQDRADPEAGLRR